MQTEELVRGGESYTAVWLKARIRRSVNPEVYIVRLDVPGAVEPPIFYASADEVRVSDSVNGESAGSVFALLLDERDDDLVVLLTSEPVSYGPQLVVPRSLAE